MIPVPMGTQIWVACGATDMRRGFDGLAMMVQEVIKKDPFICVGRKYVAAQCR
jgi:transposase